MATVKFLDEGVLPTVKDTQQGIIGKGADVLKEQVSSRMNLAFAKGVANAIGQGVSFGTADEAIAALSTLGGYDYTEVRDAIRANLDNFRKEDPAFAYGSEIASAMFTPAGALKLASKVPAFKPIADAIAKRPLTSATAAGAAYGAGAAPELKDVPAATAMGGALGAGGQAAAPVVQRGAKALQSAGIPVTPGQLYGGSLKRLEEAAQSLPIIGKGIRQARGKAMDAFSPVMFNRALKPIGVTIPVTLKPRAAFKRAQNEFRKKYDELLTDVEIQMTDDVLDELNSAVSNAKVQLGTVKKAEGVDLEDFVLREVLSRADDGVLSGKELKKVQSAIDQKRLTAMKSNDLDLANAYDEVDVALLNVFAKNSPEKADDLRKLDRAYANFVPLRRAASQADEAAFSPAKLLQAVKAEERRTGAAGLGRLAAGEGRMQTATEVAKKSIGAELGDSGTAERIGAGAAIYGGGGALVGAPVAMSMPGAMAGLGFGMTGRAAYTPAGQFLMRNVGIPAYSATLRSPATAGLLAQPTSGTMQSFLLGD